MERVGLSLLVAVVALCACADETAETTKTPPAAAEPKTESTLQGTPVRQGFTQPPPLDAEWLPPPPPAFLTEVERKRAVEAEVSAEERRDAQKELLELVGGFADAPTGDVLRRLGERARAHARAGRLPYLSAKELHHEYLFPNDVDVTDRRFKGHAVVLTGRIAPPNMLDSADGFKLYRQEPQVHDPVLLETSFERNFVRCRLARPAEQKLRDWETVHFLGIVDGKERGDVYLSRCIALTELR